MTDFRLDGRVAVVTGASRGIGRAIAAGLAGAGAAVAVTARDPAALEITDRASIRSARVLVEEQLGPVDILVNNAGVQRLRLASEVDEDDWDYVLDANLRGQFFCCQEFGRQMIARRRGTIVNISSAAGLVPIAERVAYATSKAGLNMLTRVLALEWAAYGITVNAIAPTFVETELGRLTLDDPQLRAYWNDRIPLGRVATVEDVTAAVVYLASPAAAFLTGTILPIDAGLTMR